MTKKENQRENGEEVEVSEDDGGTPDFLVREKRGVWIWGPTGTGKTTLAKFRYGDNQFFKSPEKWWDGYSGETVALLDDLDEMEARFVLPRLKTWAGESVFFRERKHQGPVTVYLDKFVVTSNWGLEELCLKVCRDRTKYLNPLLERFEVVHLDKPNFLSLDFE